MLERALSPVRKVLSRSRLARSAAARYVDRTQRARVLDAMTSHDPVAVFGVGGELPEGYGAGASERAVEIPWLLAQKPSGRMLDAGSALNHAEFLDRLLPGLEDLHVVTLEPEGVAFPERRISYVYSDLRNLPYRDGHFDTVASISTLEHVGMDNRGYGAEIPPDSDADREVELAVRELRRVTARGGRLLLSLPYGVPEDHGGFRQFAEAGVERLLAAAEPREARVDVFRDGGHGWKVSSPAAAADARYRVGFAAEAVVCIRMSF